MMMPSNQEYKGKGMKGRNYDELSGVGTSSAGKTGTTGNLNTGGRDGGVGRPDLADEGNLQSAHAAPSRQPDTTPAQGDSRRGYQGGQGGSQQSGQPGSSQSGQADQLRGNDGDRKRARKQESQDDIGTADPSES
jgi:hypothetical protein